MIDATVIVDVQNLAYRSHWVMPSLSYQGAYTGMLHGFLSSVRALQKLKPKNIIFAFDYGTPEQPHVESWRKVLYLPYKAKRKKPDEPSVVLSQLPELYKALQILGYPCVGVPGLEADDICGIIASRPENFLLFSIDDDLYQLLDGQRVKVLRKKQTWKYIIQRDVEKQFGFPISKFPTYLTFGGDHSDNIKPLRGCGPAGALSLVLKGANPLKPYDDQPQAARNARYRDAWGTGAVLNAYQVAHIPRSVKDWRIKNLVEAWPIPRTLSRQIENVEAREENFLHFLSRFGLMDHIAQRSKFFEEANL